MTNFTGRYSLKDLFNRVITVLTDAVLSLKTNIYPLHESEALAPGGGQNGYDVKTTGGMFGTVNTSYKTVIKNNDGTETVTAFLNTDNVSPFLITKGSQLTIDTRGVTNIFLNTEAGQTGTVEVALFGE